MLSIEHQQMLVWAARPNREDFNVDNKELNEVIETIRKSVPEKFHNSATVRDRKFYDEPRSELITPNNGYVRSRRSNVY
jgi:hypothetical protein